MPSDIQTLNKRLAPRVSFEQIPVEHQTICSTNKRVDHYNRQMLDLISSEGGELHGAGVLQLPNLGLSHE
jgi:hypothetical protein